MVRELRIDFDLGIKKRFNKRKWRIFIYHFKKLFTNLYYYKSIKIENIKVWESHKGFHIIIKLNKEITHEEQLLYQCFLLSDIVRELFNYCRLISGNMENYNFFAKKKIVIGRNGEEYRSEEKITKNSNRILRRLLKEKERIEKGEYKFMLGEYY